MIEKRKTIRSITSVFILSFIFAIIQFFGGLLTNSSAILIDSIRNFGDAISIGIALILEKKASYRADSKFTYGYYRFSVIGSLISTMFMLISSIFALLIIIPRIIKPEYVNHEGMFLLAIVGLLINGMNTFNNSKTKNINEKSINLYQMDDIFSWVSILIVSTVISIYDLSILDPILSIVIILIPFKHIINHLKDIFDIVLEKVPDDLNLKEIEEEILKIKNILDIKYFHIWSLDGIRDYASLFVVVNKDMTFKGKLKCSLQY